MLCLQNTKTYCQSHKLPVCPNRDRSFVVEGEGRRFTYKRSPLEAEWAYFKQQQKVKMIYFKNPWAKS